MTRREDYLNELVQAPDAVAFLRNHSGLPGPRANLELMQTAAETASETDLRRWLALGFPPAGEEQPTDEYLAGCGIVGLGRLVAGGRTELIEELRGYASDPRWRVRETVAMALQRVGDDNPTVLFQIARDWATGRPYVQRAAIAAVAEPRLLKTPATARAAIDVVDAVTLNLTALGERRSDEVRTLRQALAYCWSVVVAADREYGKPRMERWAESPDPDIRWVLRENLKKNRIVRVEPAWVESLRRRLAD